LAQPQLSLLVIIGQPLSLGLGFAATRLPSPGLRRQKVQ
jgi:hypothetical protein